MQQTVHQNSKRIVSIDYLRGSVMIIMALDHVRDYFHAGAYLYDPLDLDKTTAAFLTGQRKTKKELSIFLLKRGGWLVLLELTLINFEWNFDIMFTNVYFIVIWALGVSMIVLAGLIHLPKKLILAIGIILVAGHNLLDGIHVEGNNLKGFGWALLHEQAFFNWHGKNVLVGYPLLPWFGIMALGYCLGNLYTPAFGAEKRKKALLTMGTSAIVLFIVIRFSNVYGDPHPWSLQPSVFHTFLSFIKVNKYPPSL